MVDSVARNAVLDSVTEEDIEEGRLNDDQIQAMWHITLEEAQSWKHKSIVAVCTDASPSIESKEMAKILYDHICEADGMITKPDNCDGLLSIREVLYGN